MSTQNTTTTPSAEELQALTEEASAWMEATGRKNFPRAKQDELAALGVKRCGCCTEVRRITEFAKCSSRPDGLQSKCRLCANGANAKYRAEHLEERRAYGRERRTDEEYRQREREYKRAYYEANYRTHPTLRLNNQLGEGKRRTLEAGGVIEDFGAADLLAWWEEQGIPADRDFFTDEPLDPATRSVDHLWPVSEGGPHIRAALVPVTIGTNLAKGSKSPAEFRDWLRSEGIEPAERPDPTPFLIEALADRAAEQDPEELPEIVKQALSTTVPVRAKRNVVVQIEEEGATNE